VAPMQEWPARRRNQQADTVDFAPNFDGSQEPTRCCRPCWPSVLTAAPALAWAMAPAFRHTWRGGGGQIALSQRARDDSCSSWCRTGFHHGGEVSRSGCADTYSQRPRGSLPMREAWDQSRDPAGKGRATRGCRVDYELPYQLSKGGWIESWR